MNEKKLIKEKFLRLMIKHKIVSTSLPFIKVSKNFDYLVNENNGKTIFLNEDERDILLQLNRISYEEFNSFYYNWISDKIHIIKNKRRNKEHLITTENMDILELELFSLL